MEKEKEIKVDISANGTVDTNMDTSPIELPTPEDCVANLCFWFEMIRVVGFNVNKKRFEVPEPLDNTESEV